MKGYEVRKCRRIALSWSKERLADEANLDVRYIEFYEEGKNIPNWVADKIDKTLWAGFNNLESIEHFKKKILEEALKISREDNTQYLMQYIGHMLIEAGKLQMELMK